MQIFNQLGGIELSNAYKLDYKQVSKKDDRCDREISAGIHQGDDGRKGVSRDKAEEIFGPDLEVRRVRFQQVSQYSLRNHRLSDGVHEGTYHPVEYMSALPYL